MAPAKDGDAVPPPLAFRLPSIPVSYLLLAALIALLINGTPPLSIVIRLPAPLESLLLSLSPTPKCNTSAAPPDPQKYYFKDFEPLFLVTPVLHTTVDPTLVSLLASHDITTDKAWLDDPESNLAKQKQYGPYLARGFESDARLYVAWTGPDRGYGLFADVGLPIGTVVGVYGGVVTNASVGSRYSWHYNSDNEIMDVEGNPVGLSIDAWYKGNYLRFSNHDTSPNCLVDMVAWNNLWHVIYVTSRAISPGEEITVSYGQGYWSSREHELKTGYTEGAGQRGEMDKEEIVTVVETVTEGVTVATVAAVGEQ